MASMKTKMGLAVWTFLISEGPPVINQFYYIEKNRWPQLGFGASLLKLLPEVLLTILIESWVRQVAPKILTCPSRHHFNFLAFLLRGCLRGQMWAIAPRTGIYIPAFEALWNLKRMPSNKGVDQRQEIQFSFVFFNGFVNMSSQHSLSSCSLWTNSFYFRFTSGNKHKEYIVFKNNQP